jgi:hypothetical protein
MSKIVAVTNPVAIVDNASWTTNEVDSKGFDYAVFYVMLGATDIAMAAFKLQESSASGSGFTDVTGAIFGTSTNTAGSTSTLPSATDDNLIFAIEVDLRPRRRYLDLVATAGDGAAGTYAVAWCELSRAGETPMSATQRGCSQILRV